MRLWTLVLLATLSVCLPALAEVSAPYRAASLASLGGGGSGLFADRASPAPFNRRAPRPPPDIAVSKPAPPPVVPDAAPVPKTPLALLRDLIGSAEAGRDGYDAVQHGARRRPDARPTEMTLAEIEEWIAATPGQPHAIGRYQVIPKTLRRLIRVMGLPKTAVFDADLQDRMADQLMLEAGLAEFTAGTLKRRAFMRNLAKVWAGLPLPNGKSYYHGYAGNRATMSWRAFEAGMARAFDGA